MNSTNFRTSSLNKLLAAAAQDPRWSSHNKFCAPGGKLAFEESATPHTGCYGYVPTPANCDNKTAACSGYELSVKLESGGYYTKSGS